METDDGQPSRHRLTVTADPKPPPEPAARRDAFDQVLRFPKRLIEALRLIRTAAFWSASPLDSFYRHVLGNSTLPPLWLRRHAGAVGSFESSAKDAHDIIRRLGLVASGDRVLDLGCGPGVMVKPLGGLLGASGTYVGVDIHEPSIRWCRRRFRNDPRFRFEVVPAESAGYQLPIADMSIDFVLAKSLFTHLLVPEAVQYLKEIRRVLRGGKVAMVTAFLFSGKHSAVPAFPFADPQGYVRWRVLNRPRAATAFDRDYFASLVSSAGLALEWIEPGFWPGSSATLRAQDIIFIRQP